MSELVLGTPKLVVARLLLTAFTSGDRVAVVIVSRQGRLAWPRDPAPTFASDSADVFAISTGDVELGAGVLSRRSWLPEHVLVYSCSREVVPTLIDAIAAAPPDRKAHAVARKAFYDAADSTAGDDLVSAQPLDEQMQVVFFDESLRPRMEQILAPALQ